MNNFVAGLIRTWVPIGVGAAAAWALTVGVSLDSGTQAASVIALTGILQGGYYTAVRFAAKKWSWVGILLGVNKAPDYGKGNYGDNPDSP